MKKYILLLLLCLPLICIYAQRQYSASMGLGFAHYYGDLTEKLNGRYLEPGITASASYYLHPNIRARVGFLYTQLNGADSLASESARIQRNLHFRSPLTEFSFSVIYEILRDKQYEYYRGRKPHITPFVFAGLNLFHFNPQAELNGEWHDLQPLGTEGQYIRFGAYPDPYSRWQLNVMGGLGLGFRFSPKVGLEWELAYRKTFTDYLDDVSTRYPDLTELERATGDVAVTLSNRSNPRLGRNVLRGNSGAKDGYFFTGFALSFFWDTNY